LPVEKSGEACKCGRTAGCVGTDAKTSLTNNRLCVTSARNPVTAGCQRARNAALYSGHSAVSGSTSLETSVSTNQHSWAFALASTLAIGAVLPTPALAASDEEIVQALRRGDCNAAVQLANSAVKANEAKSIFVVGRMVDEGVCTRGDGASATPYFARAAALGFHPAALDQAVQTGLGEGVVQSYARAGELCQMGGLPVPAGTSAYALGYICTVRGVASRLLRRSLVQDSGTVRLSFNPASGALRIESAPRVSSAQTHTGTYLRTPQTEGRRVVELTWRRALSAVPKPDAAQLPDEAFDVTLDLDETIELALRRPAVEDDATRIAILPADIQVTPPKILSRPAGGP
jgi:hypothetical protein